MKSNYIRYSAFLFKNLIAPLLFIFFITAFFLSSCSKDSGTNVDINDGRYQYPNYIDGFISISHSWYRVCEDSNYNNRSKEFFTGDTIFVNISEVLGPNWQVPEIKLDEIAEIICSNSDIEQFTFNFPYPECVTHIDGVLLWFSGIKTQLSSIVTANNDIIEVNNDTVVIVTRYESYWTGNMVTDTAYIDPTPI